MKRIIALSLALMVILSLTAAYAVPRTQRMQVTITPTCVDYNHVGEDWYEYYELNGYELLNGDLIDFTYGDQFTLFSQMSEKDVFSYDIGSVEEIYAVDTAMLRNGFTVDQYLTVSEDSGVFKDYWCEWYIHFEFLPV